MDRIPAPAILLILATLLPLASFGLLVFIGKRMGTPLSGVFGTLMIAGSFVCSILATISWINGGRYAGMEWGKDRAPINIPYQWIPVGGGVDQDHPGYLDVGIYVDSLTIVMFAMITGVATLVHIFSIGYMHEDKRFSRFFTYLGLFCFSMLGLVIGGTLLQLFIFWELVGLCSYLLIGFWYEKRSASNAAIKAFIANRVGDFGFLIGFGILFYHLGNVTLPRLWQILCLAGTGESIMLPGGFTFTSGLLTIMGLGLFFGAVGKSAQFPLHVWLPDAMEGPTPVSALIHAATMVAAGVYLVGRIFPILSPDAKLFIAIIGCTTLTMAALIALAQTDIKKVLAYSTLSQLGYMILAMGIGSWVGGLFHLITHAFFKALLFLGSGSVIHAAHHEQELPQYGGLIRKIPMTGVTFLIAVFAIAGFGVLGWGFSGFYSKDMILHHAAAFGFFAEHSGKGKGYWLLFYLPAIVAYITPFYMMRCWMLTFWGKPRNQHLYDHAHETPVLWLPLAALAVASVIGGYNWVGIRTLIESAQMESTAIVKSINAALPAAVQNPAVSAQNFSLFQTAWKNESHSAAAETEAPAAEGAASASVQALDHGEHLMHTAVGFAWLVGIGLGFFVYMNGYAIAGPLMKFAPLNWVRIWLYRRMYFDELYFSVFVAITMGLSAVCAAFDRYVIDGLVNGVAGFVRSGARAAGLTDKYVVDGAVNGMADLAQDIGAAVRAPQSGRIRMYVTVLMIAVSMGLAGAVIVALSK
jgi:proton-translocating NADH-quinone oxidoreductase chain L